MRVCTILWISALGVGMSACRPAGGETAAPPRPPQKVEVAVLEPVDLVDTLAVAGTLEANESVTIQPEIAGVVREIAFEEGARVEAGTLLARLDDAELAAQVREAEARAGLARLDRERAEALAADRTLAQAELDRVRSEETAAVAALDLLRVRLARTRILAPFSGVLGARRIAAGDYVTPATALTTLDDLSSLKVGFQVPERSVERVRAGTAISVSGRVGASAAPVVANGQVFFVGSSLDPTTRAGHARGRLDNPPPELRPGMFVSVSLELDRRTDVLAVAEAALLGGQGGVRLIAVGETNGQPTARYVRVQTGLRVGPRVEVRAIPPDTLMAGDRIITSGVGALTLFPGAPIQPLETLVPLRAIGSDQP